jgi:hypothetical protein
MIGITGGSTGVTGKGVIAGDLQGLTKPVFGM